MWTAVRPRSLATSLKVGMGGKPLRSFFSFDERLAGGGTGTGTRCGPCACVSRNGRNSGLKKSNDVSRERVRRGLPVMSLIIPERISAFAQRRSKEPTTLQKKRPTKPLDGLGGTLKEQVVPVRS